MIKIKIVVIFEVNFDLKKFEFEIKKSKSNFDALFIIKFKSININEICEICRKINYIIYDYKIIISFRFFKKIKFFLLKNKLFIL